MSATRDGDTRNVRQAERAASANSSPKRKLSWLSSPAEIGWCSATRRISRRKAEGNFPEVWPSNLAFKCGGAPEIRARATSIPSAEVPDIMPRTSIDRLPGFKAFLSFQNPSTFFIFKIRESSRKARQKGPYSASVDSAQCFRK